MTDSDISYNWNLSVLEQIRSEAEYLIERLLEFLDRTELMDPDCEPSLGWTECGVLGCTEGSDLELDNSDMEDSLGWSSLIKQYGASWFTPQPLCDAEENLSPTGEDALLGC